MAQNNSKKKQSSSSSKKASHGQEKQQQPNAQTALIVGGLIVILVVLVGVLATDSNTSKTNDNDNTQPDQVETQTCQQVCQAAQDGDYAGATSDSCVQITECESPNRPLVDETGICNSAIEACCCKPA